MIRGILNFWEAALFDGDGGGGSGGGGSVGGGGGGGGGGGSVGNQAVSFAAPSRRSAERDSMAALENVGGTAGAIDAVGRERGKQAANPLSSSPSYTYPSTPKGYQPSGIDPLAGGGHYAPVGIGAAMAPVGARMSGATFDIPAHTSNAGYVARNPQPPGLIAGYQEYATERARAPSKDQSRLTPRGTAPPPGRTVDLSIGQNHTFSDIANTAPVSAFSPRAGMGPTFGLTAARGMTPQAVPATMVEGVNSAINMPAANARSTAMGIDTPVRSTASVAMAEAPRGSVYTDPARAAAFTQPQPFRSAVRNDMPFGQLDQMDARQVQATRGGTGAVVAGRNVSQMVDASMATNNMAPGMARAPAPAPAAQRGLTEEQERSAAAYEQQMLKDLPAGSVYSAETAPSNPVYGDRFRGFGAGGPLGGLLTGNLFNADGTRSSASFVGSTGDGEGRGPWWQSEGAEGGPAPAPAPPPPPAVNVVEALRRFVDDYIYPTPPVKWPRRELTYQP